MAKGAEKPKKKKKKDQQCWAGVGLAARIA